MSGPSEAVRRRAYCRQAKRRTGGPTSLDNPAFACWSCNLKKGPNLSGIDPATGQVTALFHPRKDEWPEHFSAHVGTLIPLGVEIRGLTPKGRSTVRLLGLNEEMRQMVRYELWREGLYTVGT